MNVVHFQRRPHRGQFSLERVFSEVRRFVPREMQCHVRVARYESRGFWRRIYIIFAAWLEQMDVNHVLGDIHFASYLLKRKQTILTILDCSPLQNFGGIKRELLRILWYVIPVRCVSVVTVISESTKRELVANVCCPANKIRVIPCCISDGFHSAPKRFNQLKPNVLQVGTGKNKNVVRVAQALEGITCTLRIIGVLTDEQHAALTEFGIEYVELGLLPHEALPEAYRESDVVVFASTYEGFGLPILEANATGRPVVTSNLFSMPEVAGDAACLVDPYEPAEIRAAVLRIIEDRSYRDELIRRGYANAARFSSMEIARQYADLYAEVAGETVNKAECAGEVERPVPLHR